MSLSQACTYIFPKDLGFEGSVCNNSVSNLIILGYLEKDMFDVNPDEEEFYDIMNAKSGLNLKPS